MALSLAAFAKGKTVLSLAIGGSVGNAVTQLARAQGAKHAISSTTNHAKAQQARYLGFDEVTDLSEEKLSDGVRRITKGYGADNRDRCNGRRNPERGSEHARDGRKSDNVGLVQVAMYHRRHGPDLEARDCEELLPVRTTGRNMGHRMRLLLKRVPAQAGLVRARLPLKIDESLDAANAAWAVLPELPCDDKSKMGRKSDDLFVPPQGTRSSRSASSRD
jgi:threonine dehydrogenase-like Zn-dependent dehydrogenase